MSVDGKVGETINAAMRIDAFFKDEIIKAALDRTEKRFIEEMIAGDTAEKRAAAQGKVKAIRGFVGELRIILDAGEYEILKIAQDEAKKPKP